MKSILIISVLLLMTISKSLAQEPKSDDYIPQPQNKKFEGTWETSINNYYLKIIIVNKKRTKLKFVDFYADYLEGYVTLRRENKIIINNEEIIKGGLSNKNTPYTFTASLSDPKGRNAGFHASFKNEKDTNNLLVTIIPRPNNGFMNDNRPVRLPEKIILKRVE